MKKLAAFLFAAWFIALHDPGGDPIYVNAEQIDYIGPAGRRIAHPAACSQLMVYGVWMWVKECPDDIKRAIDAVLKQG